MVKGMPVLATSGKVKLELSLSGICNAGMPFMVCSCTIVVLL